MRHKDKEHLKPEHQAITANPDTYVFDLTSDIDFIVMGCDGIWEKRSNEEMIGYVYDKIERQLKEENETNGPGMNWKETKIDWAKINLK